MTTDQFLNAIATRGLLTADQVARVRAQVANSATPVSPKALAKHLIDKGLLTVGQAQALLAEPAAKPVETRSKPATKPADEDFGLVPLDEGGLSELPSPESPLEELPLEELTPAPAKPKPKPSAPEPSSLLDELGDLGSAGPLAGSPLDLLSGSGELGAEGSPLLAPPKKKGLAGLFGSSEPKKRRPGESEFDSPLMLFGGGALVLMLIVGGLVYFLYARGSGDEQFRLAEEEYRAGSYSQALAKYNEYLEKYPTHPSASMAKVHRGLARLRQATEKTNDYSHALEVANTVVNEISGEKDFGEAKAEFRSLFPDIAEGLAKEATAGKDPATVKAKLAEAEKALALVMNTSYVPQSQRPVQRITAIREIMAVATRDLDRDADLTKTIAAMQQATEKEDISNAYALRKKLLKSYPDLAANESLAAAVQAVAKGEKTAVQVAEGGEKAEEAEAPTPVSSQTALASRVLSASTAGAPVTLLVEGAVFGIDSGTGAVLWRRYVGRDCPAAPLPIDTASDSDVLVVDARRNELLRLTPSSGKLVWRQTLGERIAGVTTLGKQAIASTRTGKLVAVDLKSGAILRTAKLPQVVRLAAAGNSSSGRLYQAGEQSSVYALSGDLACQQAFYLGHETGTVALPPMVLAKHLLVIENHGVKNATLHVLGLADDGTITATVQKVELPGHVLTEPVLADRKLVLMTVEGHIKVMGVNPSNLEAPLADLANQPPSTNSTQTLRQLLVEDGNLWIADNRLIRYKVQSAAGRLMPSPLQEEYEAIAFDGPLQISGKTLIHARRLSGKSGVRIGCTQLSDGSRVWETLVAVPLVDRPVLLDSDDLLATTSVGQSFALSGQQLSAPVVEEAVPEWLAKGSTPTLASQQELGSKATIFAPDAGSDSLLIARAVTGKGTWQSEWIKLPEALACAPARFGKGLAVPTRIGQVFWLNPATGKPVAAPFQPQVTAGSDVQWTTPDATADGKELVISDGPRLYRVGLARDPAPHLEALATSEELAEPIVSPVAVLEEIALAANESGQLFAFSLKDLATDKPLELGAGVAWGPRRIGKHVLLSTAEDELVCLASDGQIVWQQTMEFGPLAGSPALSGSELIVTSLDGHVARMSLADGRILGTAELGEPLGSGAVLIGKQALAATADGTLLTFELPPDDAAGPSEASDP